MPSWMAPECVSINRLPMRATAYPFPTTALARTLNREKTPWYQSLNGDWQFRMATRPEEVSADDVAAATDRSGWARVAVPGNWTLQGYGHPHYTNVPMPFPDEPPFVPSENPTGIYVREFSPPADWQGRRIIVHFGGAESVLYVYVNGQAVGLSKDSRLPSEFDLTPFVTCGQKNVLAAVVVKWSDASFIEDQDQWWMGGLHREVYLYSTAPVYLADIFARGDLEDNYTAGRFQLTAKVRFPRQPEEGWTVETQLHDPRGKPVLLPKAHRGTVPAGWHGRPSRLEVRFNAAVARPLLWSAEVPALYTAVVTLRDPQGRGWWSPRPCGWVSGRWKVAGPHAAGQRPTRVLIKGVNRHDHHDTKGKALDRETLRLDAVTMKRFNVNAVRCSHYPERSLLAGRVRRTGAVRRGRGQPRSARLLPSGGQPSRALRPWRFSNAACGWSSATRTIPAIILWSLGNETAPQRRTTRPWRVGSEWLRSRAGRCTSSRGCASQNVEDLPPGKLYDVGHTRDGRRLPDVPVRSTRPRASGRRTRRTRTAGGRLSCASTRTRWATATGRWRTTGTLFENVARRSRAAFIWEWIDHGLKQTHGRRPGVLGVRRRFRGPCRTT